MSSRYLMAFDLLVGLFLVCGCISCSDGQLLDLVQPNQSARVISPQFPDVSRRFEFFEFCYSPDGLLAAYDTYGNRILQFDNTGQYVGTLAGGEGDDALALGFGAMTMDRAGKLLLAQAKGNILEIDPATGARHIFRIPVNKEEHLYRDLLVASDGVFYLSSYQGNGTWQVLKYDPHQNVVTILHKDDSRRAPADNPLNFWVPRLSEDINGDILIPDLWRYRIWVYRKDGSLRRTVDQDTIPPAMTESDLVLRVVDYKFPLRHWVDLPNELRHFPAVVAVLATPKGNKMVFTSYSDGHSAKFRVDVWDADWRLQGHSFVHNALMNVPYQMAGDRLVAADLNEHGENGDRTDLSRFEVPSVPSRVLLFETSW